MEVFVRPLDGSDSDALLLTRQLEISETSITRDGQWIVYRQGANSVSDLYARRLTGDTFPVALAATGFLERIPTVSPDGRYLAYMSDETGRLEVYIRPFPDVSDGKWLVSTTGGMNPVWSRDGSELFYQKERGDPVAVETSSGSPPTGRQRVLFSALPFAFASPHWSYDVTPDGRFVMFRKVGELPSSPLVVVENFFEELRRQVPR
jgi:serine/threonine-protein kinase